MLQRLPQTNVAQDLADLQRLLRYVETRRLVAGLRSDRRVLDDAEALRRRLSSALRALQARSGLTPGRPILGA
jgi:hypothetical protein